jgi:hypothetical protein
MKRFAPRIPGIVVVVFALCSLGSDTSSSGCMPSSSKSNQTQIDPSKPFCLVDPPVNCVAFCFDVDSIAFTPQCDNIEASVRTALFKDKVLTDAANKLVYEGIHVCTKPDSKNWVTPCQVGITQQEHLNQDHEVCQPVPPGCPTF